MGWPKPMRDRVDDTLALHAAARDGARKKPAVALVDLADALRRRDFELRGQTGDRILPWDALTNVDKRRWLELAIVAVKELER